jgi:hypothetical protein
MFSILSDPFSRLEVKLAKNTSKPFSHVGTKRTKQSNTAKR